MCLQHNEDGDGAANIVELFLMMTPIMDLLKDIICKFALRRIYILHVAALFNYPVIFSM
jgi:hypothetical protein